MPSYNLKDYIKISEIIFNFGWISVIVTGLASNQISCVNNGSSYVELPEPTVVQTNKEETFVIPINIFNDSKFVEINLFGFLVTTKSVGDTYKIELDTTKKSDNRTNILISQKLNPKLVFKNETYKKQQSFNYMILKPFKISTYHLKSFENFKEILIVVSLSDENVPVVLRPQIDPTNLSDNFFFND